MSAQKATNTNSNLTPVPASSTDNSVNGITNFNINNNNSSPNNNNINNNYIPSTSDPIQNPATQASQFAFGNYLNNFTDIPDILNVATQNIRGELSHLSKQLAILEIMSQPFKDSQYIDILGFSHTGIIAKQSKHVFTYDIFSNYTPFFSAGSDSSCRSSGVGFLIANNFATFIQKTGQFPGRVIYIDFFTKNHTKLRLIQVYIPPFSSDFNKQTRVQIRQYLHDTLAEASRLQMHVMI